MTSYEALLSRHVTSGPACGAVVCVCVCVHQAGGQHPRICVGELRGASIHRPGLRQPAWAKAEDEAKSFRLSEMSEEVGHSQSTEAAKQASSTARGCWQGAGLILQM